MIKSIEKFKNIKSKVLKITTIYGTFYFYKLDPKTYNYKIEYLVIFEYPNRGKRYIGFNAKNIHNFFEGYNKEKYSLYELIFSNELKDNINNYIINSKKVINEAIGSEKGYYSASQAENISELTKIYYLINKIEKELKHLNLEEVII